MGHIVRIIFLLALGCGSGIAAQETCPLDHQAISITEAPYQVAIENKEKFQCGASIVSETFILTAAHCVSKVNLQTDRLSIRTKSSLKEKGATTIAVKAIFLHPKYVNGFPFDYDIAFLELENPIYFDEKSQPIKLADRTPAAKEVVQVSGWETGRRGRCPVKELQAVNVTVIDSQVCQEKYKDIKIPITPSMFCVETDKQRICPEYSGSPVTLNQIQVGIISLGTPGCRNDIPIVAVNLADPEIKTFLLHLEFQSGLKFQNLP